MLGFLPETRLRLILAKDRGFLLRRNGDFTTGGDKTAFWDTKEARYTSLTGRQSGFPDRDFSGASVDFTHTGWA